MKSKLRGAVSLLSVSHRAKAVTRRGFVDAASGSAAGREPERSAQATRPVPFRRIALVSPANVNDPSRPAFGPASWGRYVPHSSVAPPKTETKLAPRGLVLR